MSAPHGPPLACRVCLAAWPDCPPSLCLSVCAVVSVSSAAVSVSSLTSVPVVCSLPREQWVLCPEYDYKLPEYRTACTITGKTQPVYRTGAAYYNFTMNITNVLGTRLQWLGLVNNFAIGERNNS